MSRAAYPTDLIAQIGRDALEPEYRATARHRRPTRGGRASLLTMLVVIGLLLGSSAAATARSRPESANERAQLIGYVRDGERGNDELRGQIATLHQEISRLQKDNLGSDADADRLRRRLEDLEVASGMIAVTGPGLQITIDDADDGQASSGRILDVDLRQAVNGLWLAGADAVAINGHRISSLTSVRSAGDAITVEYRSLVRPYVITAIGDPKTLPARWTTSSGSSWLTYLKQNYRVRYEVAQQQSLTLPASSQVTLREATPSPRR